MVSSDDPRYHMLRERVATDGVIDLDEYPDHAWLEQHVVDADRRRTNDYGVGWIVQHGGVLGGPYLMVGIRGSVGAAQWMDEEPGRREIPAHGIGETWQDYFTPTGQLLPVAPGSRLSLPGLHALVRSFAQQRQRPRDVRWLPEPTMRAELLPPRPAWLQLRHMVVLVSPHDRADELVAGCEQWNRRRARPECGITWGFTHSPYELFSHGDVLDVGVRGELGALQWWDANGDVPYLPVAGSNAEHVDYFSQGHHHVMPPRSEVPIDLAYEALREFVTTKQRPTCLDWHLERTR